MKFLPIFHFIVRNKRFCFWSASNSAYETLSMSVSMEVVGICLAAKLQLGKKLSTIIHQHFSKIMIV